MRTSTARFVHGTNGQTAVISANPNRVRIEFCAGQVMAGYASIYIDSSSTGGLVGSIYYNMSEPVVFTKELHGDLVQRRFIVAFVFPFAPSGVGIVETIETEQG